MRRYILIPLLYLMVLSPLIACSGTTSDNENSTLNNTDKPKNNLFNTQLQTLEKARQVNQQLNEAAEKRESQTNQ